MAPFPYLPLFTDPWVASTHHLSRSKRGAYLDLLVLMWRSPGCRIPNDNGWLQEHLACDKDELREVVRPVINEFCRVDGNFITQKRLQHEYVRSLETQKRLSALGKRKKTNNKDTSSA